MILKQSPELILKERALKLAQKPDSFHEEKDVFKLIIFSLGKEKYAVEMKDIKAVQQFNGATFLPGLSEVVVGVINFEGQIFSVLDLKKIFNLSQENNNSDQHLLIVDHPILKICLLIDNVLDFRSVPVREVQDQVTTITNYDQGFVKGMLKDSTVLIDLQALIQNKTIIG